MREKDMKRHIRRKAKAHTPDVKDSVKASPQFRAFIERSAHREKRRRRPVYALAFTSLVAVLLLALFIIPSETSYSQVYLEINPSIRLDVDEEDTVLALKGENDDGDAFIEHIDDIEGGDFDTAIERIIENAIETGHLSEDAPHILYDAVSDDEALAGRHTQHLEQRIPEVAQERIPDIDMMRGHQGRPEADVIDRAQDHDIGVMRVRLIDAILEETDDYTFEELADYSVGELRDVMDAIDMESPMPGPPDSVPGPGGP